MPIDTIDPCSSLDEVIAKLLNEDYAPLAPARQPLCNVADADALAGLVRKALHRLGRLSGSGGLGFQGVGTWAAPIGPATRERSYRAEVELRIELTAVSGGPGIVREGWMVVVSGKVLHLANGQPALFDTREAAMQAADRAMAKVRLIVDIPTTP